MPLKLRKLVDIESTAMFVGMGEKFQIWHPDNYTNDMNLIEKTFRKIIWKKIFTASWILDKIPNMPPINHKIKHVPVLISDFKNLFPEIKGIWVDGTFWFWWLQ